MRRSHFFQSSAFRGLAALSCCVLLFSVDAGRQRLAAQSEGNQSESTQSGGAESSVAEAEGTAAEAGFEALVVAKSPDGKALAGSTFEHWEGNLDYFRIEDDSIVAGSLEKKIPNNEFLCTKKSYADFDLRFEVRLRGQGNNAGVQFRSKRVPNDHEVSGYQCDVGVAWDRPVWGALYDESRRNKMLAEPPADKAKQWLRNGEWNELRVLAVGPRIRIFLNGHETIDYTETDETIPAEGIIGLQIHSGPPTEAWYRNIRIREIKPTSTLTKPAPALDEPRE